MPGKLYVIDHAFLEPNAARRTSASQISQGETYVTQSLCESHAEQLRCECINQHHLAADMPASSKRAMLYHQQRMEEWQADRVKAVQCSPRAQAVAGCQPTCKQPGLDHLLCPFLVLHPASRRDPGTRALYEHSGGLAAIVLARHTHAGCSAGAHALAFLGIKQSRSA